MRPIEFRYVIEYIERIKGHDGNYINLPSSIYSKVFTLDEIENDEVDSWLRGLAGAGYGTSNILARQQYTGLKDANGQKIFEGDILELDRGLSDYHYVVEWVFAGFQLVTYKKPNSTVRGISDGINQGYFEESDNVTVIGNIYENGELINEHK